MCGHAYGYLRQDDRGDGCRIDVPLGCEALESIYGEEHKVERLAGGNPPGGVHSADGFELQKR
ncbi:hypothetical protein NicSoilB8_19000 [Arthrobacter sp. NicSoilB8]|nr:hypothetical protein NicSoilB8_19000 [Arthrobacter sp. NicSoilB8]